MRDFVGSSIPSGQEADKEMSGRVRWLMFLRIAIVTFLLGLAAFIQLKHVGPLQKSYPLPIYSVIIVTYVLSFFYFVLLRQISGLRINIYIQAICDTILITILVYVTGGIESNYSAFYPLVVIYSVLFLSLRGGMIIASLGGVMYGVLLSSEFYGLLGSFYDVQRFYSFSPGHVATKIAVNIISLYVIVFLTSFVVEQEKNVRKLLAEKEHAFDRLDALHRSIVESVEAGILTFDLAGRIRTFNRAASEITGYHFTEVFNRNAGEIFPGLFRTIQALESGTDGKRENRRFEMIFSGKAREKSILGFSISPLLNSEGEKVGEILIFQDVTAAKKLEQEIEKSKRFALIGEMAAGFAHEIRNPLAAISGSIQLLQKGLELNDTDKRLMRIIMRGKDQMEAFLKDFLLLARPGRGERERLYIPELIDDIIESLRNGPNWVEGIEISKSYGNLRIVRGNKSEIRQAILNVILNAFQAMPQGGSLQIECTAVSSDNGKEYIQIGIYDNGCGIKEEDMEKIFEPFFTTRDKGTGLGLAIVRRIVESHQGKIFIESGVGRGARCRIILPAD
ncbi:MAG: nitrogen regulation protein NR(II) [Syntrophales bacterium]